MRWASLCLLAFCGLGCGVPKRMLIENRKDLGPMDNVETITDQTPEEFLKAHAGVARIGLYGGLATISKAIREGQSFVTPDYLPSLWCHAWVFEGPRADDKEWIQESTLEWKWWPPQVRNGIQENRLGGYYKSPKKGQYFAVIDWSLNDEQQTAVLAAGLKLVSEQVPYPVGNLFRTLWLYWRHPEVFGTAQYREGKGYYCSAFVQKVYLAGAGIDFNEKVKTEFTSPEHVWFGSLAAKGKCKVWLLDNDGVPTFGQKVKRFFVGTKE